MVANSFFLNGSGSQQQGSNPGLCYASKYFTTELHLWPWEAIFWGARSGVGGRVLLCSAAGLKLVTLASLLWAAITDLCCQVGPRVAFLKDSTRFLLLSRYPLCSLECDAELTPVSSSVDRIYYSTNQGLISSLGSNKCEKWLSKVVLFMTEDFLSHYMFFIISYMSPILGADFSVTG